MKRQEASLPPGSSRARHGGRAATADGIPLHAGRTSRQARPLPTDSRVPLAIGGAGPCLGSPPRGRGARSLPRGPGQGENGHSRFTRAARDTRSGSGAQVPAFCKAIPRAAALTLLGGLGDVLLRRHPRPGSCWGRRAMKDRQRRPGAAGGRGVGGLAPCARVTQPVEEEHGCCRRISIPRSATCPVKSRRARPGQSGMRRCLRDPSAACGGICERASQ